MNKNTEIYARKTQLIDYVTKQEFHEFKDEMYDFKGEMYVFRDEMYKFRNDTEIRFSKIDKRFDQIERKLDDFKESVRIQFGIFLQEMRDYFNTTMEYMRNVESKKVDKEEFAALELRVDRLLNR